MVSVHAAFATDSLSVTIPNPYGILPIVPGKNKQIRQKLIFRQDYRIETDLSSEKKRLETAD